MRKGLWPLQTLRGVGPGCRAPRNSLCIVRRRRGANPKSLPGILTLTQDGEECHPLACPSHKVCPAQKSLIFCLKIGIDGFTKAYGLSLHAGHAQLSETCFRKVHTNHESALDLRHAGVSAPFIATEAHVTAADPIVWGNGPAGSRFAAKRPVLRPPPRPAGTGFRTSWWQRPTPCCRSDRRAARPRPHRRR